MKPIGIVIATRWEASPIIRGFGFKKVGARLYRLERDGQSVWIVVSGVGSEAARKAAYRLCDLGARELVSAGFCGALVPELHAGDIVTDRIATMSLAVLTRPDRLALAEKAGARAADMETQAIIEAGTRRGVPIRVLRVVSDELDDDLSPLIGSRDVLSPWRVALKLWNPARWPLAFKLWRQSCAAKQSLLSAISAYLQSAFQAK